jgi:hypothetical protein
MWAIHLFVLLVAVWVVPATPYQYYQDNVPNGVNVPGAPGFGHVARAGGGSRNSFGKLSLFAVESLV